MIALDTNVVVRFLVRDDEEQARRARALIDAGPVLLPATVVLETAWVLRAAYGRTREEIAAALKDFVALPTVEPRPREAVLRALAWHRGGMDAADALHLASSEGAKAFATFDRRLRTRAAALGAEPATLEPPEPPPPTTPG